MIADKDFKSKLKPKNIKWSLESLINSYRRTVNEDLLQSYFEQYWDKTRSLTPKYFIETIVIYLKKNI